MPFPLRPVLRASSRAPLLAAGARAARCMPTAASRACRRLSTETQSTQSQSTQGQSTQGQSTQSTPTQAPKQSTPTQAPAKSVATLLAWSPAAAVPGVVVHGFVRSVRAMKRVSFVTLGDGSTLGALQAVVPAAMADGLANGAAVRLAGAWTPSLGAGQSHELHVDECVVLGPSDAKTFPIQKKYQSAEFLRTVPHLRPRVPLNAALLRVRSDVVASLTRFFAARDFVQTQPPLLTSSDCEGAGEVFGVRPASADPATEFFRTPKYLTVSTQLHLEALAQAVGHVWTLSPTFRAEESDTPRHLSEFYMLEAETSFVDGLGAVMDLLEDMLRHVATDTRHSRAVVDLFQRPDRPSTSNNSTDTDATDTTDAATVAARWDGLAAPARWPRITYTEAVGLLQNAPVSFEHTPVWGASLQTEHEKYLASSVTAGGPATPVFVTHYPRASKAFYMLPSADCARDTVDCFDLLVPEFCEIAGGSMREHRLPQLVATMRSRGMVVGGQDDSASSASSAEGDLDWYVDLRRWGCPPHGGFGVGFDRLLCYLTGVQTIRDMVAFPRWHGRCDC